MTRKNIYHSLLSLALVLTMLCMPVMGMAVDDNLNDLGVLPLCKEPITLTIGMLDSTQVLDWETNYMTQQLEKDSNIHLEFVSYGASSSEAKQKLELQLMAGGQDIPDIINFTLDAATLQYFGEQGMFIPLDEYIANSSYFMHEGLSKMKFDPWQYVTSPDGNTYSLLSVASAYETDVWSRIYISDYAMEQAGVTMPTTVQEFEDMLRKMKDVEGIQYPFVTEKNRFWANIVDPLISPFVYANSKNEYLYYDENGEIAPAFTTDGWREALMWIRSLVDEELLHPISFTQDLQQLKAIANATDGYTIGVTSISLASLYPAGDDRTEPWSILEPLAKDENSPRVAAYGNEMPSRVWMISADCKYPEAAFRLGDLLMSQKYSAMTRWGEEGVDWVAPEAGAECYYPGYEAKLIPVLKWGEVQNKHWANANPMIRDYEMTSGAGVVGQLTGLDRQAAIQAANALPYVDQSKVIGSLVYTSEEYEQIAEIKSNITSYYKECFTRFCLRDMSLEDDWDTYLENLNNMGLETYMEIARGAHARMTGK